MAFNQIANALSGFSAGVSGKLPEFQKTQQLLSNERKKAAATDLFGIRNDLMRGNASGAMSLLGERITEIQRLGGDPAESIALRAQISSGQRADGGPDFSNVIRGLDEDLAAAQAGGFIDIPNPIKGTSLVENAKAAGLVEGTPEFQQFIKDNISGAGTTINLPGEKGEVKAAEELAKLNVKQFGKILDEADAAEETLSSVLQLRSLDFPQGGSVPVRAALADAFAGAGIDTQALFDVDLGNVQAFNSVNSRLVNQVLNQAKGPQTEGDAQRAQRTLLSLGNQPEANDFVMDTLQANALRKIEQRDFMERRVDEGDSAGAAKKAWNSFKRETPMLSTVSKVARNGIPVYFFQFKEQAQANRPGVSDEEIVRAWREANK